MNLKLRIIISALLILAITAISVSAQEISVSDCMEITSSGYYAITQDIYGVLPGENYCIKIFADDVVLDGQGYTINGGGAPSSYGILIVSSNNVTLKNLNISGYSYGIRGESPTNVRIENNTISGNSGYGIYLFFYSSDNIITNNTISDNGEIGVYLYLTNNTIIEYNNISGQEWAILDTE